VGAFSRNRSGFTLIEMCAVIFLASLIVISGTSLYRQYLRKNYIVVTNNRINAIHKALQDYIDDSIHNPYHLLPCPADPLVPSTSPNFGKAVISLSAIHPGYPCPAAGGYGGTPGGPGTPLPSGTGVQRTTTAPIRSWASTGEPGPAPPSWGVVRQGAVPVRDLGLSNEYAAEPNGWLFIYAVSEEATNLPPQPSTPPCPGSTCFTSFPPTALLPYIKTGPDLTHGAIDVRMDATHSIVEPPGSAIYVIISPGKDGRGAYNMNGILNTAMPALGFDLENRDNDQVYISAPYSEN
jgi:type II secretory pathway pseudopilin PulG